MLAIKVQLSLRFGLLLERSIKIEAKAGQRIANIGFIDGIVSIIAFETTQIGDLFDQGLALESLQAKIFPLRYKEPPESRSVLT